MPSILRPSRIAALGAAFLWLGACATPAPPQPQYPPIAFEDRGPIHLEVGEVEVELAYRAPDAPPNVDHLFPVRPAEAARRWPGDRLVAAGTGFRARFVIKDAAVVAVPLEQSGGLTGLLTQEQSERYDARLAVELVILDTQNRQVASARAEAVRSRSVPEDITLSEREQVWYEMTRTLMSELDKQLEQTIRTSLTPYVLQ